MQSPLKFLVDADASGARLSHHLSPVCSDSLRSSELYSLHKSPLPARRASLFSTSTLSPSPATKSSRGPTTVQRAPARRLGKSQPRRSRAWKTTSCTADSRITGARAKNLAFNGIHYPDAKPQTVTFYQGPKPFVKLEVPPHSIASKLY